MVNRAIDLIAYLRIILFWTYVSPRGDVCVLDARVLRSEITLRERKVIRSRIKQ
jgi:hypothetical protein